MALLRTLPLLVVAVTPACFLFPSFDDFVGDGAPDGGASDAPIGADAPATCNADLTRDPKNCGACAHDCQRGACDRGACQAFTFTNVDGEPIEILTTDSGIYVTSRTTPNEGVVAFFSHDGKQKKVIASGTMAVEPRSMVVVGKRIFWTNQGKRTISGSRELHGMSDGFLATANLDEPYDPQRVQSSLQDAYGLTTDGTQLYFTTRGTGCMTDECNPTEGRIISCGVADRCASPRTIATSENGPRHIVTAGGKLYWTVTPPYNADPLNGRVRTAPTTGGAGTDVPNAIGVYDIALDPNATALFASTSQPDGGFVRVPLGAGTLAKVPLTLNGPRGVGVDDRNAYVLDTTLGPSDPGALYRIDLASLGGASIVEMVVSGSTGQALALSADAVYFTSTADGTGSIRKLVK